MESLDGRLALGASALVLACGGDARENGARAPVPGVVEGLLVEASSGAPLPRFAVEIEGPDGGTVETVETDAAGRFRGETELAPGRVVLLLRDLLDPADPVERLAWTVPDLGRPRSPGGAVLPQPRMPQRLVRHEGRGGSLRVEARAPTFRLDADFPEGTGPGDFFAAFPALDARAEERDGALATAPPDVATLQQVLASGDEAAARQVLLDAMSRSMTATFVGTRRAARLAANLAPLRDGEPPWARFPPWSDAAELLDALADGETTPLELRSFDGRWVGSVDVPARTPERLHALTLTRAGCVRVEVTDSGGHPLEGARVVVSREGRPRGGRSWDRAGKPAFEWLAAGSYVVRVEAEALEPWEQTVRVEAGAEETVHARLEPVEGAGVVAGVLRWPSEAFGSGAMVRLESALDHGLVRFAVPVPGRAEEGWEATFRFPNVPPGEYRVRVEGLGARAWEPATAAVSPPREDLVFTRVEGAPLRDLGFRVRDAGTGRDLEPRWEYTAVLWLESGDDCRRVNAEWSSGVWRDVPADAPLRWIVRADGYRLAAGDASAFVDGGDVAYADVELEPGWGEQLRVQTPEGRPIEGATVRVDGEEVGATDACGMVQVRRDAPPEHVGVTYEDWVLVWASGLADGGRPTQVGRQIVVHLKRPD